MNKLKSLLVLLFAAAIIGCASTPEQPQEPEPKVQEEPPVMQTEPVAAVEEPAAPAELPPAEPVQEIPLQKIIEPVKEYSLYFAPDTFVIDSFNARRLDSILRECKEADAKMLTITGHSAKLDNAQLEDRTAMQYALAVAEYIAKTGSFAKNNMSVSSAGASQPEGSHAEISERGRNRRVEITYK